MKRRGDDLPEPPAEQMDGAEQAAWSELLRPVMDRMIEAGVDQVTITRRGLEATVRFKPRPRTTTNQ